ncbi:MAG: MG2 domain-containing protein, partial [Bacteroidota bacterium]|nr:MG2 domain-containing protein [Bacteroidota bacterium]
MSKKKILFYSGSLVVLLIVVFAIVHLMKGKETNADNPEFAEYITAYSYGVISKADPIQIHLTGDVVAAMNEKKKQPESLFEFSPSIDGKYEMKGNVVEFTPEKSLPSGKSFYTQFKLGKLIDIKKSLKSFNFKFETIEQELDFEVTEQVTTDLKELKYQQLKGVVSTADIENAESISSILVAKYKRDELNVKWESGIDGLTHFFTIDSIKRTKDDHEIKLKVDGGKIGAAQDISKKINIPGFQNFELINSKVYNEPEQFLELQFSDPIQPNQNLDGLIRIKGINNPRFVINANTISVYTSSHIEDTRNITVSGSIKNVLGYKIGKDLNFAAAFTELKPEINFLGEGNILPSSKKGMLLAFEAVNLKAVDVAVIKIHENNILQFLQSNDYDGSYRLRYVGKPIAMETIQLDQFGIKDLGVKNTFHLDLNKITETEPGAIYRIVLKVKKEYSLYSCALSDQEEEEEDEFTYPKEINWDEYENEFGYRYYYWRDRDDACKEAYYYELKKGKNILTSNLGLIAKKGKDNSLNVFVTDIHEAGPKEGVSVEIYDYQKQLIANAKTDKDGKVTINDVKDAQFAVAKLGTQKGYIKLADNEALNLSKFEVAGKLVNKGLKGYIYEERGVRRPGDSIYLTFVLNQENAKLPANHPMKLELKNSRGNILKTERRELNSTGFYTFRTRTEPDAPTGNYVFTVELGALKFSKIVKVETIKPNRLSIKLDFENKYITEGDGIDARITAKWLHGATAKNMRVKTDMTLMPQKTEFTKFSTFVFDDPVKSFNSKTERIYEGTTNDEGVADIKARVYAKEKAPGMLTASFTTKVFEKSGNFSINKSVKAYSPYNGYLGMTTPETDDYKYYYDSGEPVKCEFVTVTPDGKLDKSNRKIEFQFYKLNWRWWWNSSRNRISSYSFRNSAKLIKRETKISSNGKITWNVETEDDHWGRYLVWAKDTKTGHSTGKIIYFSWPYRSDGNQNKEGASMLVFNTDKEKYAVGDKVKVTFPSNNKGNALVSIENGTKSIKSFWTKTEKGTTEFSFKVTEDMHPNAYIHITLLQEYMQTANDLPIRMYGVMPLNVEDKNTILNPVIE